MNKDKVVTTISMDKHPETPDTQKVAKVYDMLVDSVKARTRSLMIKAGLFYTVLCALLFALYLAT